MKYSDLYNEFQNFSIEDFKNFLRIKWEGNCDKLEASFKLLSYLKLFTIFNNYCISEGNYNNSTLSYNDNINIKELLNKNLGGKGDKSDLSLIDKNKNIIVTTIKNYNYNYGINDLDIRDISDIYQKKYKNNGYNLILCIVIPDKNYLLNIIKNCNKSSNDIKEQLLNNSTIIIDYNDIYESFNLFKIKYSGISLNNINYLNNVKQNHLILYMHQKYSISKTLYLLNNNDKILWGHLPRSGKTYIMGGTIIEYFNIINIKNINNYNVIIITTSPNETIPEYLKLFKEHYDFNDFNIICKEDIKDKKKPILTNKNIIIVSKQFLQNKVKDTLKTKKIKWLSDINFNIRFIDESHNGGTTELAKTTLDIYGDKSKTIYITATYIKPISNYNIINTNHILWDLEDNELCKNILNKDNYNKLVHKYGLVMENTIKNFNLTNIEKHYNKIPKLHYITWKINDTIRNDLMNEDNYGFSINSILMLKNDKKNVINKFVDENKVIKLIKNIFGYERKENYSLYNHNSLFGRINNIISKPEYNSRWFSNDKPLIVITFLPCGINGMPLDILSETFRNLIIDNNLLDEFEIICINSKNTTTKTPKEIIEEETNKAIINNKKGVLVLTGKKCSLGITIKNCDIVLLLTNIEQYDSIFQMMYRCMTEDDNKSCGFVIDLNIQRCIDIIMNYALKIHPNKSSKDALKYILEQRLIEFNVDEWNDNIFSVKNTNIDSIISKMYNIFTSKSCNCIDKILENIEFKMDIFSKDDQELVKKLFNINKNNINKNYKNILDNDNTDINEGIEKLSINDNKSDKSSINNDKDDKDDKEDEVDKDDEEDINIFNNIIKKLMQTLPLITVSSEGDLSFGDMGKIIKENEELRPIILESIITWWGKKVEKDVFDIIIMLYNKYLKDNNSFNNKVADIRDIFRHNLGNKYELSKSIDKFLIPHENEKKQNAEISTPFELRQEMINKIPNEFWTIPKKVFEPCSGKGGFLLDIVDKFMNGLKDLYKDKEERYRVIVEECLYFSDINKQNIFIAKLLLNPYNKYKLNYNEGDTLKLDIQKKWQLDGFDAVIGNPPYNDASGNKGKGHCIWVNFVEKSLKEWLNKDAYLLYVHPAVWRQVNHPLQKIIKEKQIIYLEIHNIEDGLKVFKCSTRYDWYLIQNKDYKNKTIIKCEDGSIEEENLLELEYIPNMMFKELKYLCNSNIKLDIWRYRSTYSTENKKLVSKIKNDDYKYSLIYTINKANIISYRYTNNNTLGHFNKSKFIFSNGAGFICDKIGEYGLTEWAYCIYDIEDNLELIEKCFRSNKFNKIKKAIQLDSSTYNIKVMKYFKKDFYKEFI